MDENKWIIRSENGKITGPFTAREILLKIKKNALDGTESISRYPGGAWRPISHKAEFYDYLLTHLGKSPDLDDDETNWDHTPEVKVIKAETSEKDSTVWEQTAKVKPIKVSDRSDKLGKATQLEKPKKGSNDTFDKKSDSADVESTNEVIVENKSYELLGNTSEKVNTYEVTQTTSIEKEKANIFDFKKITKENKLIPLLFFTLILVGSYFYLNREYKVESQYVEIKGPSKEIKLSPELVKESADKGLHYFKQDTFSGYVKAQDHFVKVLEADKTYGDIYSLLCLTHYNLWPFSSEQLKNIEIVIDVVKQVQQFDPKSLNFYNCNNTYLILSGSKEKAMKSLSSIIDRNANSNTPPTLSYFLKADLLLKDRKYAEALEHSILLQEMWPDWLAVPFLHAQINFEMNNKKGSILSFKKLLKLNSRNKKARVYIGAMRNLFYQQYEKSIDEINSALSLNERIGSNTLALAHYFKADSFVQLEKNDRAKQEISRAYAFDPLNKKIESMYINFYGDEGKVILSDISYVKQGDDLFAAKDFNAAQAYYKEALKINNKNTQAAIKVAKSLEKLNLGEEALEILKKSLSVNPKSVDVTVTLAQLYIKQFEYKNAFEVLNMTHKRVRGHFKIYLKFAELEYSQSHYLGAIKYTDKSLKIYGESIEAYIIKGKSYLAMGKNQEAYAEFIKALKIDNSDVEANVQFVKSYYRIQGIDASVKKVNSLIDANRLEIAYHFALADLYYQDEQFTQAETKLKQVIEIDQRYQRAYILLADTYKQLSQLNDAKNYYFKAAQLDLQNSEPQVKLGVLYLETKKYDKALKHFKSILEINKNFPKVRYYYAKSLYFLKKYRESLEALKQEKILNPNNVESYLLSGEIYEILGEYQLCKREFQQALKYREFGPAFYLMISKCHRKSGSLEVAINMLEKAREISPNLPDVYRELGAVYEARSNNEKAIWSYERYLFLSPGAVDAGQINSRIKSLSTY